MRKANKDLKTSTHLVVKEAEGSKYQAAKKWNIPAISKRYYEWCILKLVIHVDTNNDKQLITVAVHLHVYIV